MHAEGDLGNNSGGENRVPGLWVSVLEQKIVNTLAFDLISRLYYFIPYKLGERKLYPRDQDKGPGEAQDVEKEHRTWR